MLQERQPAQVVDDGKLQGLITEHVLIVVSSHLLERYLDEGE